MRIAVANVSRGNPSTNTIGMTACMPTAIAQRPIPVTMPPAKAIAPIVRSATGGQGRASWIAVVAISASAKPKPIVRAF